MPRINFTSGIDQLVWKIESLMPKGIESIDDMLKRPVSDIDSYVTQNGAMINDGLYNNDRIVAIFRICVKSMLTMLGFFHNPTSGYPEIYHLCQAGNIGAPVWDTEQAMRTLEEPVTLPILPTSGFQTRALKPILPSMNTVTGRLNDSWFDWMVSFLDQQDDSEYIATDVYSRLNICDLATICERVALAIKKLTTNPEDPIDIQPDPAAVQAAADEETSYFYRDDPDDTSSDMSTEQQQPIKDENYYYSMEYLGDTVQ